MPQATSNGDIPRDGTTETIKSSDVGTSCTLMKLWEGRSSKDRLIWLTEPPEIEPEEGSTSASHEHAITLLHRDLDRTGKHTVDVIIMRSPELQNFLEDTIPNISSHYNETEQGITIRSPFRLLYWYLDYIETASKDDNEKLREVATLLQSVLEEEFREIQAKHKELLAKREMNFDMIWTLFKPGITALTSYEGKTVAVKVVSIEFKNDALGMMLYRINYTNIGWDGEYLGWQDGHANIFEFSGRRKITDLEIFPINFHQNPDIVSQLALRGKRFVEIAIKEPCMMSFNGEALDRQTSPMWWEGEQKKKVDLWTREMFIFAC